MKLAVHCLTVAVAFVLTVDSASRFSDERCYDTKAVCALEELRKLCSYTRWHCRDLGFEVKTDNMYPHITGDCDKRGPTDFCRTAEKAKECKADKEFCNEIGYWLF
ncbi:uncharacterized protein LOC111261989 [Varroa jacobsoni]|uniref:Uncharacterized protein n=1 Tax=Varroa destructor TaxID=109461 RepID=A0A7M7JCN6_VARDE|nr:uncharacterized protein LOC111243351 [Varroa destructor]XP_022691659.1 uncharacterized protein LOC111261989 [Varroa jacobsoni]